VRRLFPFVVAVVLVDTMFYAAITPLLPHYVDDLGLSKSAAGILSASYAAGALAGSLPGGWLAARIGGRPTVLVGLALMALSSFAFAFGGDVIVLDTARFVQGVGGACSWAGGLGWLVSSAPRQRRGELIGSVFAAAIGGVLLGPVLGGAATLVGPAPVFSVVALLGLALAAWALTIPAMAPSQMPGPAKLSRTLISLPVVAGFWLVALPSLFSGVLNVLVPLRLDQLGASGVAIGAIFLVAAGLEAVATRALGVVSDRRGRLAPVRIGLAVSILAALTLPLPGQVLILAGAVLVAVVGLAFFWAPATALLSDAAEATGLDQGFAFALVNLAWAGGQVVGGSGGAGLADRTSDGLPYVIVAALCGLTMAFLMSSRTAERWSAPRPRPFPETDAP
jgi:MFS family permease